MRFPELPLRPTWLRALLLGALAVFLTVYAWWPMFAAYPGTPIEDGHYFYHQIEISKATVRFYHEAPLWNPFDCRGIPMWDHPENITASPIFWATLPFSAPVTIVVWNVFHVSVGFIGMWLLCRHELKLSRAAAFVGAAFWAFGAGHTSQYAGEHEALISFYNAPLLLLLWRRAEEKIEYAVGTGIALAWMVYDGATYPLPFTVVMLGIESFTRVYPIRRGLKVGRAALIVGLVAFSLGASRILPLMDQFSAHNRVMEDDIDQLTRWASWRDMYTMRSPAWRSHIAGQQYVFGEYIAYVGWLGVALAAVGLALSITEGWWLFAVAAALVVLMLGHFGPRAPWTWLHAHLFPFKSMRVAARFRLLLGLIVSAWIAYAVDRVPRFARRFSIGPNGTHAVRVVVLGLALLACGDMIGLGKEILNYRFADPPPHPVAKSARFYYGGIGVDPDFANQPRQNRAYLGCRAAWVYNADAAVWSGDVPPAKAGTGATVVSAKRTHNTFTIEVNAERPSQILVNSAYDRGWQTSVGAVVDANHLLAVDVPAGHHTIQMRYWPRRMTLGVTISLVGVVGVVGFFVWRRRRRRVSSPANV